VRISLSVPKVCAYCKPLEHLVRYCARPAFALDRLAVIGAGDESPERIRYTLPRHKRGQWIGSGRQKKATSPNAQGVITLSPHEFLSRLAALVPPPRKHRHRNTKVFAPNHPLRSLVTAMAIGNVALLPRPPGEGRGKGSSAAPSAHDADSDAIAATRSHDTSRIAWANPLARIAEAFPLVGPPCGGDIRLIA